tara:strand:+ start:2804 stop:3061 length:258 start_codon:yes stop_codon:yes gene_type:complete
MFKLLLAVCLGVMTPQGPRLVNCSVMVEQPERWYQSEEECAVKAKELQKRHEEQFKGTPVIGRLSCLPKERLEEIEAKHGEKIRA